MKTLGICLVVPVCALSLPGDENWSWKFFANGPDNEVIAIETVGNDVYIGGDYTSMGPYPYSALAKWNGGSWSTLGSGLQGNVVGIAVDARGHIFVAGSLISGEQGTGRFGLAQWDGKSWLFPKQAMDRVGSGPIAAIGNEVFLTFYDGGNEIHRWTGTELTSLKSAPNGQIKCLKSVGSTLYVGGTFSNIGGVASNHVAKWSEGKWTSLSGGVDVEATCMTVLNGELLVGGKVLHAGIPASPGLSRWDGQKWTPFTTLPGNSGSITHMAAAANGLIYVSGNLDGNFHAFARWNGSQWTSLGQELLTYDIRTIALSGGQVWVGGRFAEKSNPIAQYLAVWDGTAWSSGIQIESAKPAGRCLKLASKEGKVFGMGTFATAQKDSFSVLSQWTGSGWNTVGPKIAWSLINNLQLNALEVDALGLIVAGDFQDNPGDNLRGIRLWQGAGWLPLGTGLPDGFIYAIKSTPAGIFVGGNFSSIGEIAARNIALWNGKEWSPLGAGTDKRVTALEWDGKSLLAGGLFDSADGRPSARVAQWQNGSWSALGDPVSERFAGGEVNQIRMHGSNVVVAGTFKTVGTTTVNGIAMWKDGSWAPMGAGFAGSVNALAVTDHDLFAGGRFAASEPGTYINSVARWNGSAWEPLGSGLTDRDGTAGDVSAMAALGADFFVAGTFLRAGGKASNYFAQWTRSPQPGSVKRKSPLPGSAPRLSGLMPGGTYVLKEMIGPSGIYIRDFLGRRSTPYRSPLRSDRAGENGL